MNPGRAASILLQVALCGFVAAADWHEEQGVRWRELPKFSGNNAGFKFLPPGETAVAFTNILSEQTIAENRIAANGAGVALGDFDGNGLPDIFACGLESPSRLYRNLGNWKFRDDTAAAGLPENLSARGAVFADINGDGQLDLLITTIQDGVRCFINTGGNFRETTQEAGLQRPSGSTTLALADIDGNGTLDLYVANYRTNDIRDVGRLSFKSANGKPIIPPDLKSRFVMRRGEVSEYGEPDHLYLNDGKGHFTPVSWTGGAFLDADGKPLSEPPRDWGLTATFRDVNGDGAPDLYVCNDYWTPDRFWINDGKGRFRAAAPLTLRKIPSSSMGVDFADINRDGRLDFFCVEMLASDARTRKRQMLADKPDLPAIGINNDLPQIFQNTLFLQRDDGTFAEAAYFAGLEATDWSWSPLFVDVDLDGFDDLLISAGHFHDVADYTTGTWEMITTVDVPAFTARFQFQEFQFTNFKPYKHYRWTVTQTATSNGCCMQVAEVELLGGTLPPDVTQPGDPIIASSSNSPTTEGVANVIDNGPTKYLNFDSRLPDPIKPSGFVVTPSIGRTVVTGMTIESANDAPERDPKTVTLEGSNDDVADYTTGTWTMITTIDVPAFTGRFQTQTFLWDNYTPYKHYRWTTTQTATSNGCCMQVAEVELLGTGAPVDVTQPGDPIIASSSNSPTTEGVANVIDNGPTKYLNFDSRLPDPIKPSGFIVTPSVGATTVTGMTIESANDAPERDPKTVTLEGSNDDVADYTTGTWTMITTIDVPAFTGRFQTQEFFFANTKSYKHYRWTTTQTATSNGCCMQVAEVELLAAQLGADCNKAAFTSQPVDQPVLLGSKATFNTTVNGPWPLQWTKNGQPIPGATGTSFTTDVINGPNDATNVYAVSIVGCQTSPDVHAVIFNPSTTKSVAINFTGGGANGAPTAMATNDIAGVQLQAYWNQASLNVDGSGNPISTPGTGTLPDPTIDPPVPLLDSDGNASDITFDWNTGGSWGSGTGTTTATDRMLNGLVGRGGPGTQDTYTFSNVPAGNHSVLVYSVSPPKQFQRISYNIGTTTYYMRALNSDEYKPAPGFYRSTSTDANAASVGDFIRFDNVQADSNGQIVLTTETLDAYERQSGVNGIQLVLNSGAAQNPPTITADPQPTVAKAGDTLTLSVTATGSGLTYQWRKSGRNISNGGNISGATSSSLSISSFSAADEGVYSVAVFNGGGSVISKNATATLSTFNISDALAGYWKLDETTGTTAANSAPGAAANSVGVVVGTPQWGAGQVNGAFTFDGNTFIYVTNYPKASKAISGSAWVNIDPNTATDVAIFRNAQGDMTVNGGTGRIVGQFEVGLTFDGNTGNLLPVATVGLGPSQARVTGTTAFPTGSWHQIAFTADGAQLRLYVDGQQVAVVEYLADINPPDIQYLSMGEQLNLTDPMDPTSLGPDPTTPKAMFGSLDEVAIWNRALTANEVTLLYQAENTHKEATSVVENQPTQPATLTVTAAGGNITITWTNGGTLYSAAAVNGPWTTTGNSTGAFTGPTSGAAQFYKVQNP